MSEEKNIKDQKEYNELNKYFSELNFRIKNFNDARKKMDIYLSSSFNVFHYIKPNENGISDVIADILTPNGSHGQEDLFLRRFFEIIIKDKIKYNNSNKIEIKREAATNYIERSKRRIDITISCTEKFGIGIENKLGAPEQENQVKDYIIDLRKKFGEDNFVLIYLTGYGNKPTSIDNELREKLIKERKLIILSYNGGLLDWLECCYKECESNKYRWFLKDFIQYINLTFPTIIEE